MALPDRIRRRINRFGAGGCWLWTGALNSMGYGNTYWDGGYCLVHRVVYVELVGPIGRLCVLHRCDNPPCCNPEHLFLGTRKDNNADMMSKGRGGHGPAKGEKNPRAILSVDRVIAIKERAKLGFSFGEKTQLAREYGIARTTLSSILTGKNWKEV